MEKNQTHKKSICYIPEHEGARGEWEAECEERRQAVACIIARRDFVAVSAMNGLISKSHPNEIINYHELCREAYKFAEWMDKERQR